jgi:hypothetical protein
MDNTRNIVVVSALTLPSSPKHRRAYLESIASRYFASMLLSKCACVYVRVRACVHVFVFVCVSMYLVARHALSSSQSVITLSVP